MSQTKVKFSTQVECELLKTLKNMANKEGRRIQSLIDEALRDLLEKRNQEKPRTQVMERYQNSHKKYATLYERLAK